MSTPQNPQSVLLLYTEQTPNPESLKFVSNQMLYQGIADFKDKSLAESWSPLAARLYEKEYVQSIYISNNFVTITKEPEFEWHEIMIPAKEYLKSLIESGVKVINEGYSEFMKEQAHAEFSGQYDEKDSIGKRYRRQDAIGTPYCVTVDHKTLEDNTVTIRERDTMEQKRVYIEDVEKEISEKTDLKTILKKLVN